MITSLNSYFQKLNNLEKSMQNIPDKSKESKEKLQHTSPMKINFGLKEKINDNCDIQKIKEKMEQITNGYHLLKEDM